MKIRLFFTISGFLFASISCLKDQIKLPDQVLPITNEKEIDEILFSTAAYSINDESGIIGYSETSFRPLDRFYERENQAFYIKSDYSRYQDISLPDAHSTWPVSINNNSIVAGSWLPLDFEQSVDLIAIPCSAFIFNVNTGESERIAYEDYTYTYFKSINNNNIALGYAGNDADFNMDEVSFLYNY